MPGLLGMGLVEGYDSMNLPLAQPELRAELEADLKRIAEGRRDPEVVLREQVDKYREVYRVITQRALALDQSLGVRFNAAPQIVPQSGGTGGTAGDGSDTQMTALQEVMKCQKCNRFQMILKRRSDRDTFFITCLGFPDCKSSVWFGDEVKEVRLTDQTCSRCGNAKKLAFKFKNFATTAMFNCFDADYTTCILCDSHLREALDIRLSSFTGGGGGVTTTTNNSGGNQNQVQNGTARPAATTSTNNNNNARNVNSVLMNRPTTNASSSRGNSNNSNNNPPPASRGWGLAPSNDAQPGTSRGWNMSARDNGENNRPNNKRRNPENGDGAENGDTERCTGCNGPVKR